MVQNTLVCFNLCKGSANGSRETHHELGEAFRSDQRQTGTWSTVEVSYQCIQEEGTARVMLTLLSV